MNRFAVVAVIGLPVSAGVLVPAGPSGAATVGHAVAVREASPATLPNSNIKGNGAKAKFKPPALSAAEATSADPCSTGFESFTVTNKGKKTQYVTFGGSALFSLPKKHVENVCLSGGSVGVPVVFHLSNSTNTITYRSTLTVTLTD